MMFLVFRINQEQPVKSICRAKTISVNFLVMENSFE